VREQGVTEDEVARARRQLRARFVFESDSVTNIAHQLGYFETVTGPGFLDEVQSRVAAVTASEVSDAARRRLSATNRTVGWFQPQEP
jgi:zinc protease